MMSKNEDERLKYSGLQINCNPSLLEKRLKVNLLAHLFKRGRKIALYNPLNQEVVYGDEYLEDLHCSFKSPTKPSELSLNTSQIETLNALIECDIIVNETFDEQKEIEQLQEAVCNKFQIDLMYLVISNACNYSCDYCFVTKDDYKLRSKLNKKSITKSIDLFLKFVPEKASSAKVVIYGGEPLINEDLIKFVIGEEHNRIKSLNNKDLTFEMITNG